jgi:chemotaxis protein CheX
MLTSYANEIEQIAQAIYSTMLGIDTYRLEDPFNPCENSIVTTIEIHGDWKGTVVLGMSPELAQAAAAAMFRIASEEVTLEDRQDVGTELINMVGGNFKSLLPGPHTLSLPQRANSTLFSSDAIFGELSDDLSLISEHGPLRVCVFAK